MAKISESFGSNFIRTEDLTEEGETLTIDSVEEKGKVGSDEKMIVHFTDERSLPLNKTNAHAIAKLHGDESDEWEGKSIRVYKDYTMFDKKRTSCTRVGAPQSIAQKRAGSGSGSGSGKTGRR